MKTVQFLIHLMIAFPLLVPAAYSADNFRAAKKQISKIHAENPVTIYCPCRYLGKKVDIKNCGYVPKKDFNRAERLEWEHVVPAEAFGQAFSEWRSGAPQCVKKGKPFKGRKCAETNPTFAKMEADLHNLWPSIGELNGLRSNFSFAQLRRSGEKGDFGRCGVTLRDRKFEPMDEYKGIVARTYLYMDQTYPGRGIISDKNRKLFEAWDKMVPVTPWECKRAEKIQQIQHNANQILLNRCSLSQTRK